jgi:hypothetical protein
MSDPMPLSQTHLAWNTPMDNSTNSDANAAIAAEVDMVLVLSSELVCQIAEKYFNSTMLKKKVKVLDLQATSAGLVQFSVAFVIDPVGITPTYMELIPSTVPSTVNAAQQQPRTANGKFRKVKDHE